ncbi:hypothetical protein [Thermus tenuipuniceus]|uniref:hypothetical protein n=1 Tax=Thermus tenuipuniceus TaxID=2078690 RepID=UPI000CFA12AF|nr:hypothetical protein [Thermus tenuipuniceus]
MGKRTAVRLITVLALLLVPVAWASISLLTGAVLLGADRLSSLDPETEVLDRTVRSAVLQAGEVCLFLEHHRYDGGLSYLRASSLRSSLSASGWEVREVAPFSPFLEKTGVWVAFRGRERVFVFLIPLKDVGYVSFCQVR